MSKPPLYWNKAKRYLSSKEVSDDSELQAKIIAIADVIKIIFFINPP